MCVIQKRISSINTLRLLLWITLQLILFSFGYQCLKGMKFVQKNLTKFHIWPQNAIPQLLPYRSHNRAVQLPYVVVFLCFLKRLPLSFSDLAQTDFFLYKTYVRLRLFCLVDGLDIMYLLKKNPPRSSRFLQKVLYFDIR